MNESLFAAFGKHRRDAKVVTSTVDGVDSIQAANHLIPVTSFQLTHLWYLSLRLTVDSVVARGEQILGRYEHVVGGRCFPVVALLVEALDDDAALLAAAVPEKVLDRLFEGAHFALPLGRFPGLVHLVDRALRAAQHHELLRHVCSYSAAKWSSIRQSSRKRNRQ